MKGIILAGGEGTRLYPLTQAVSKQLLPVYDKPMIYYPLSVLMLADIRDVLIITTPEDSENFKKLLGDGSRFGMNFTYKTQEKPNGIAEAFIIGKDFIGSDSVALVLGDNVFYGQSFSQLLKNAKTTVEKNNTSVIFGYLIKEPQAYGVINFDESGRAVEIEEKPENPKSNYAVPGLYFYTNDVIKIAERIRPSERGELEITDINNTYLKNHKLSVELMGRGMTWLDTGTYDGLLEAGNFIATIQKRQGMYVSCIEEIAYKKGWINKSDLAKLSTKYKTDYGKYLKYIAGK